MRDVLRWRSRAMVLALVGACVIGVAGAFVPATSVSALPATGTVVIVKNTIGSDGVFRFELNGAAGAGPPFSSSPGVSTTGNTGTTTVTDVPPGAYTLSELVPTGWELDSLNCDNGSSSETSEVGLTIAAGATITCTFVDRALVTVTKAVTSGPTAVAGSPGQFDVGYTITVVNSGPLANITVSDALFLGPGIARTSGPVRSAVLGFTADASWDATISNVTMGTAVLNPTQTLILPFSVRVQVAPGTPPEARDCEQQGEQGTGTFNAVIVQIAAVGNRPAGAIVATACAPLSTLTLHAQVVNDNGGTLAATAVNLTATDGATAALSGPHGVTGAVGTDPLTLAGADVAGYTKSAFTCAAGVAVSGGTVIVAAGTDAVCTIVYDDIAPAAVVTTTTAPATVAPATTTPPTTQPSSTLPKTGGATAEQAGLAGGLVAAGAFLLLLAGRRRRAHPG